MYSGFYHSEFRESAGQSCAQISCRRTGIDNKSGYDALDIENEKVIYYYLRKDVRNCEI